MLNQVLKQIKVDVENGELEALCEMIKQCPYEALSNYLPDESSATKDGTQYMTPKQWSYISSLIDSRNAGEINDKEFKLLAQAVLGNKLMAHLLAITGTFESLTSK